MFYTIIRIFFKGEQRSHSVEYFYEYNSAVQRYFNIIAADLANADVTWNAAYIIDSNGMMLRGEVFDRIPVEPEIQD